MAEDTPPPGETDPESLKQMGKEEAKEKVGGTKTFLLEAVKAIKEAGDDKVEFVERRLEAEAEERDKRSKTLYEIARERAEDQQVTIRRLWIANIIQALIIAALAGKTVGLDIPGFGGINLSAESGKEAPADDETTKEEAE